MSTPGPGQILFAFVRHWSRRFPAGNHALVDQGRLVLVTEAVHSLAQRGLEATVNAIAHEIGIDQSGASRLVKVATESGYLALQASRTDARQRRAQVTSSGHTLLRHAHEWQEQVFNRLTDGWSAKQRRDFQHAMTDLIDRSYAFPRCQDPT